MIQLTLSKQLNTLQGTFKEASNVKAVVALLLFVLLNTFKISLFNYYLFPVQTGEAFEYKFVFTLLLFLIIYPLLLKLKTRVVFLVLYVIQTVYLLTYLSYYLYFHSYLHPVQWVLLFKEAFLATKHLSTPMSPQLLVAFIDLPVFVYIAANYFKIYAVKNELYFFRRLIILLSLLSIVSLECYNYAAGSSLVNFIGYTYTGESPIVGRYGTVVNDIVSLVLDSSEKDLIKKFQYGKEQSSSGATGKKPNFVVIQVESLDANIVNQKYKDSYVAPFLHSLSGSSIYYPYLMSYHKGGGTSDSEFSIINSVEPLDGFPAMKLANYDYPNSMLSRLAQASYHTIAFHGNAGSFYNRDAAFPKMGFTEFLDMRNMNMKDTGWGAPDSDVFTFAGNRLKEQQQPFLSYVITMTSHAPFTNALNYFNDSRYGDIGDETVRNYFNSMSYVDRSLKDFTTYIRSNFKNTYIFIYGDHTPGITAPLYTQASFLSNNKKFEFVPLFIITPDSKIYREDKRVASFMDISPTILYTSGIEFKINSDGQNLITPDGNYNKIPFMGDSYDRAALFDKIGKTPEN